MVEIRKLEMICCVLMASIVILTCSAPPADADINLTYPVEHGGNLCGFEFTAIKNGTLTYAVSGSVHFSVLVMTEDNYNRSVFNESFAYISELSALNVTSASYEGPIAPGSYYALIYIIDSANVSGQINVYNPVFEVAYPKSSSDVSIPWDIIATVIVTAVVVSIGTIIVMRIKKE
jgi:hypothetical protein